MTSPTFRVTTQGLQPGYAAEPAADQLAALFKRSKDEVAPLLGSKPVVVKRGLTREAAERYARALEGCGCVCAIEAESVPAAAAPSPPPQAEPLTPDQLAAVFPILRRAAPRAPEADPVVVRPFAGDLEIVFETVTNGLVLRQSALRASLLSEDKLYGLAVWNLYNWVHPRITFKQMAIQGPDDGTGAARFFSYVELGDGLAASCLLLQPIWEALAAHHKGPLRVAVPHANFCMFCSADDKFVAAMMCDLAAETWAESGTSALSGLTYSVDGAGRVDVVPGAHLLRTAPPPPTLPVTASAQLVVPQLHALAGNAALLALSEDRLRKLQPQLFDAAQWPGDVRTKWLSNIRHTLGRGDGRAAAVVDAARAIVASYTDELDCVVLLKFDPALAQAHGWRDGTRLFSANSYLSRDGGVAPDLRPGPGDEGRWGNVWPLIADLLTDDAAGLAARKATIAEAEWQRAWDLGRRALADGIIPRDGRPVMSDQPARAPAAPAGPASATAAPSRTRAPAGKPARAQGTFGACVKNAAIGGVCAWAVWGAAHHVAEMPHDGLFYMACFGIAVFGGIGLGCLWSAANYLRGA
ncbi:hypothetical protein NX784_20775 [Massilia pinisoli]|uniref:Uncharacterized protein n=1 Tax=Massilia pinisoli TaxID=1772194 RepID=A0ABT1ZVQ6_9BURK|nr:hypothetical protein [Massilia pinisoli]MCS0584036.1 hypothetical protein [Massilia pinisoli]